MRTSFLASAFLLLLLDCPIVHAQQSTVPATLGGPGFEKIAAELGWQTGRLTKEQLLLNADPNAKKGGSIRVAVTNFPATLRAYGKDENSQVTRMIHNMVYEPLVTVHPITLEFLPELASHWKVDPDGQTYWFRIDPNARFSDGTPVTAEDVAATYDLATDETILSPYTNSFYDGFDPPDIISPYIFNVRAREKGWKNLLYFGGTSILPATFLNQMTGSDYLNDWQYKMLPGSGPYQVKEENIVRGKRITMTRRKDWWHSTDPQYAGLYNFDSIVFEVVVDERLELEKFKKGETDLYLFRRAQWWEEEFDSDAAQRGLVQKRKVYTDDPQGFSGFVFNMRKPPFDDPKVREAFAYLFNREGVVKDMMYNQYLMIHSYYPGSIYENPNNPKISYDPEKGAALLAEAGYTKRNSDGVLVHEETNRPLEVEIPVAHSWVRVMTPIQQGWEQAGIKLNVVDVDYALQFKELNERNFDIAFMSWSATLYPNPKSSFHSELADVRNTNNLAGFKNPVADSLIELEMITFDQEKRVRILRELDSILVASHQYALSWYAPFQRLGYWNKFGQPKFYLGKISDWRDVFRTWWYDPEKATIVEKGKEDSSVRMPIGPVDVRFWQEYED